MSQATPPSRRRPARTFGVILVTALLAPAGQAAPDLQIYTDALAGGWEDWSYFPTIAVDFDNPAPVHAGIRSIAVVFNETWAALSLRTSPALDASLYQSLRFWVYGGSGGTKLAVFVQQTDDGPGETAVTFTAAAGTWTLYDIPLTQLGDPAFIARVNFQDNENGNPLIPFYVDDLALVGNDPPPPTPIFADGFENGTTSAWCTHLGCAPPPNWTPLSVATGNTTVSGTPLPSRTVSWLDDATEPRQAVMIDQRPGGSPPAGAGYLRRYTYRVGGLDRTCTGIDGGAIQGFGYVTNHLGDPGDFGGSWGNWSPNVAGTTSVRLAGDHHLIIEYSMPNYPLGGRTIPTTVAWFFATGRSHPIWTVSQDARAYPQGNLGGDGRSPYGEIAFAGDVNNFVRIAGVSWGDTYKFVTVSNGTTNESTLLEGSSGWRYNQTNTIPYVLAWTETVDAEQGAVATLPIGVRDHGSDPREFPATGFGKNQQDLDGPMPLSDDWPYQLMNYPYPPQGGTTNKKMAWGTNPGALGGFDNWGCGGCALAEFSRHRDSTTPFTGSRENGLVLAYSTFVVFGLHGAGFLDGSTGVTVREMERVQAASLSASVGTVRLQGPRGVGTVANASVTYQPAGFNPIWATWEANAAAGAATLTLTPGAGSPLRHPVFVIHGYTAAGAPGAVLLDGVPAVPGADYVTSTDDPTDQLWLTVLRTVSAPLTVQVNP